MVQRKKTAEELDREIAEALGSYGSPALRARIPGLIAIRTITDAAEGLLPRDQFDREWIRQEARGKAAAFGASEWRRVKDDWISAGRPRALENFIPGSGDD